jgi:hypothetical protein
MQEYADADDEAAVLAADPDNYPTELKYLMSDDYPRMRAHVDAVLKDDPPRERRLQRRGRGQRRPAHRILADAGALLRR